MTERLAIPNLGNYTVALAAMVTGMGAKPWWSTYTNDHALALGIAHAPESLCLPFKAHLGHFIEADDAGVENALMVNSIGSCRLNYYRGLIEEILKDMGRKIRVFGLGFDGFKPPVFRYFDPPLIPLLSAVAMALQKVRAIDTLEGLTAYTRAREMNAGETSLLMDLCLRELACINTKKEVQCFHKEAPGRFARIASDKSREPLRIGLIGEVSLLRDRQLNQNVEQILGHMGVEIKNFFLLGGEIGNNFWFLPGDQKNTAKHLALVAKPYLESEVGGHARDSVAHTIRCAETGFDAMVHVCPTGCMPEVSIRPILRKISEDLDIPVLELSFDEHTSSLNVSTRVEAFLDILRFRRLRGIGRAGKGGRV
jgi:predicted nucleotide-binding protein (sugar kinase/HSP70/actin superfamily)